MILSKRIYLLLLIIIRVFYVLYGVLFIYFTTNVELILSIFFTYIIIELTLIKFLKSWHKFNQPLLLDWFRLATFLFLIINFLALAPSLINTSYLSVNNVTLVKSESSLVSIMVILLGLLALQFGEFLILQSKRVNYSNAMLNYHFKNINLFYGFALIIIAIQFYFLFNGIVGYGVLNEHTTSNYSFVIQIVNNLNPIILAFFAVLKFLLKYKTRLFNCFFILIFLLQIITGFISGMKEEVLIPIIIVLIPYVLTGNRLPKKLIIAGIISIVFLYPINNNYRNLLNENHTIDKTGLFQLAVIQTFSQSIGESFKSGTDSYQERFSLFPVLMYSVENEGKWSDYKYMNRYLYLPFSWIVPRFILPSKPMSDIGGKLYDMTGGTGVSSITPSTFGWSYMEGGYMPLFLSFLIFGLFVTTIEKRILKNTLVGMLIFTVLLVALLKVEADIYFKISEILQSILIIILFKQFFIKANIISN